jgi:hypothetical protein
MSIQSRPQPRFRRDTRLIEVLEAHLVRRLNQRVQDLRVLSTEDGLILRGRVRTYYEKQLAQHVLMEVAGDRTIRNEIEVNGPR